ncbi:DNA adenine methylase [Gramella sp. Hel_I_59]|uniref:DNA adenine methylase n=1 Tax=Gramella sp. Hel_I_59 TaxID=1249978 RepID=UPI00114FAA61|nr:DNA adenine methylase [Gramella sp. Hel_I_59]TQI71795.1 DNA adenine methylase [Gramella sp. Hel_I_59]
MSGNSKKKIAFNYFGGKFSYIDEIYPYFPAEFVHLVELFAGSAVLSLNYEGNCIRTLNEINSDVTNFFTVLRDDRDELLTRLRFTPVSKKEYDDSWNCQSPDHVERARTFYVRLRQSYMGLGSQRRNKGWHLCRKSLYCNGGETVSRWNNSFEKLYEIAEILGSNYQITNYSYEECLERIDFPEAFFYADPPYPNESRSSHDDYKFDFTDADHYELAERLHEIQGKVMISGYNCDLMNELYADWEKVVLSTKRNNYRKTPVQECIWFNYPLSHTRKAQLSLDFSEILKPTT